MKAKKTIVVTGTIGLLAAYVAATVHQGEVRTDTSSTVDLDSNSGGFGTALYAGERSVAIGDGNTAYSNSLAVGDANYAYAESFAAGDNNSVQAYVGGFALGSGNTISTGASNACTIGVNNTLWAPAVDSFVAGVGNYINGPNQASSNVILGEDNVLFSFAADAARNFMAGTGNTTSSLSDCWLLGEGLTGMSKTLAVGTYNEAVSNASFVVGTGDDANNKENGLIVYANGDIVIPKPQGDIEMGIYGN